MLDIEVAMAAWKRHAQSAPVDKHPDVWVGHYGTSAQSLIERVLHGPTERRLSMLGSLAATQPNSLCKAILWLSAPFAMSPEVSDTVVVVDISHVLYVTHMYDEGHRSVDYRIPYTIGDRGRFQLGHATREPNYAASEEVSWLCQDRLTRHDGVSFGDSFAGALYLAERAL